jgi:MerR family mercuric resistance operon transcriptional regulator
MGIPIPGLTIGKAAQAAGVTARAVRFYESQGLMPRPQRDRGNDYRRYQSSDVSRLRFIHAAQVLGFSLAEIGELLLLDSGEHTNCRSVRDLAQQHLDAIDQRIAHLHSLRKPLQDWIAQCTTTRRRTGCALIDALAAGNVVP